MTRITKLIVAGGRGQTEPPELRKGRTGHGRFLTRQDGKRVGKLCGECGTVKHYDDFGKNSRASDGKQTRCKECNAERSREYIRERYRSDEEFREQRREYRRERYQNDEEYRERERERNRERYRSDEEFRHRKRISIQKYGQERRNNPETRYIVLEQARLREARRRARERILPDTLTSEQVESAEQYFDGCALTRTTESNEIEHFIPLSIGHGGTTAGNCYPLTMVLNYSKHARNPFEWFDNVEELHNLDRSRFDNLVAYLAKQNGMTVDEYRNFVYWCFDNPRTVDDIKADNRPSVELYWEAKRNEAEESV